MRRARSRPPPADAITLVRSVGVAVEDAAAAAPVRRRLSERSAR
jgi:ornithine cyclodeaminase/alanine dehydrogenase-like protein (mu-crystallin family)